MNKNNIIQWNCRGVKPNFEELSLLVSEYSPVAVCLQETLLRPDDNFSLKYYSCYHKTSDGGDRANGGVAVCINNAVPHSSISLNTPLQATAVRISLNKTITVCCLYLPPSQPLNVDALQNLISQLPKPFLLVGDFNSHNTLWGCDDTNQRGRWIEDFIFDNALCLLNDKSPTYLHPATGSYSALDLSICSPDIFLDFSWNVDEDLHGSDHFPIIISENGPSVLERPSRWKLYKADWTLFQHLCGESITQEALANLNDPTQDISALIYKAAEEAIPRTSTHPKKRNKPWFDEKCQTAIDDRNAALRSFDLRPTQENLDAFRVQRAKTRKTIKESKRESWRQYVSGLNSSSSVKKTWDMIRKIQGKNSSLTVNHLNTTDGVTTSKKDISNVLADKFSQKSSSDNYSEKFQNFKSDQERIKLNFKSKNEEVYNKPFSMRELQSALRKCRDTSVGSDEIHYQFLKHLPNLSLSCLLDVFNRVWETGILPDSWKEAIVIPIPKPGKDLKDPGNYRPIALTSCICKTMERMVNDRLVWFLEKYNLISPVQSGFRKGRSTLDHLVRFETFIRDAFIKKEHVVSVFFDLESAYDTTWKYGIMKDLFDIGVRGRLAYFIKAFLNDRQFRVRVGDTFSDPHEQEMGVPQGCILSVTLFSIKINNIMKFVSPDVECFLYVDDFCVSYRSKHMHTIERKLQHTLNHLQEWSDTNGFKFSKSKTKCMHFCQLRKAHLDPDLSLNGSRIEVVSDFKFLGLYFDSKLTFIPHINHLKNKCQKALNLLRVVSHMDWGADRDVLLRLYRALIRSKLDYGCIVYGSARKSYISKLDTIHHQGLRLALGAFRTSPVQSLYAEANEPSLYLRREQLSMQYYLKLKSNPENPTYKSVFSPLYKDLFLRKERVIPPFSLRAGPLVADLDFDINTVREQRVPAAPPWTLKSPTYIYSLASEKKSLTNPLIFKSKYAEIKSSLYNYDCIYTDGSKDGKRVAAASILDDEASTCRLPDHASIFSAELKAIDLALDQIDDTRYNIRYIIFTDSMSSMQALQNHKFDNPLVSDILVKLSDLISSDIDIIFCWLPSHMGIRGNEMADRAAKSALSDTILPFNLPCSDYKQLIHTFVRDRWQASWSDAKNDNNKLRSIKPELGESPRPSRLSRREEVILARLRIGHTRLTHSFILAREEMPQCIPCHTPFTIKHVLLECVDVAPMRLHHYNVSTLHDLFERVSFSKVLAFLKEINIYHKI